MTMSAYSRQVQVIDVRLHEMSLYTFLHIGRQDSHYNPVEITPLASGRPRQVARRVISSGASESEHEGPSEQPAGKPLFDSPSRLSEPMSFKDTRPSLPIPMGYGNILSTPDGSSSADRVSHGES